MDNETNPNENESEVVESSEPINENGCENKTEEEEEEQEHEQEEQEQEEECLSPKQSSPVNEPPSETDQFAVIDSDPSECSPEKGACIVSSPSEMEPEELGNDKNWMQSENESSPEKSRSETACVISSPSEAEMDESANDKSWGQLNESVSESVYEDSIDDEPESDDEEIENDYPSSPKVSYQKEREKEQKPTAECPVFELTDDNSSVDDVRSVDDDIDGDEMGEEEEDSGELREIIIALSLLGI